MNFEQHAALQARLFEVQRLGLELCEMGHARIGIAMGMAAFKALRIKPTAEAAPAAKPSRKAKSVESKGEGA